MIDAIITWLGLVLFLAAAVCALAADWLRQPLSAATGWKTSAARRVRDRTRPVPVGGGSSLTDELLAGSARDDDPDPEVVDDPTGRTPEDQATEDQATEDQATEDGAGPAAPTEDGRSGWRSRAAWVTRLGLTAAVLAVLAALATIIRFVEFTS
jgi:hypothetical protein